MPSCEVDYPAGCGRPAPTGSPAQSAQPSQAMPTPPMKFATVNRIGTTERKKAISQMKKPMASVTSRRDSQTR